MDRAAASNWAKQSAPSSAMWGCFAVVVRPHFDWKVWQGNRVKVGLTQNHVASPVPLYALDAFPAAHALLVS